MIQNSFETMKMPLILCSGQACAYMIVPKFKIDSCSGTFFSSQSYNNNSPSETYLHYSAPKTYKNGTHRSSECPMHPSSTCQPCGKYLTCQTFVFEHLTQSFHGQMPLTNASAKPQK